MIKQTPVDILLAEIKRRCIDAKMFKMIQAAEEEYFILKGRIECEDSEYKEDDKHRCKGCNEIQREGIEEGHSYYYCVNTNCSFED